MNQFVFASSSLLALRELLTRQSWRCRDGSVRHGVRDREALCAKRRSRRNTFQGSQLLIQVGGRLNGRWCSARRDCSRNDHFGFGRTSCLPFYVSSRFSLLFFVLLENNFTSLFQRLNAIFPTKPKRILTKHKNIERNSRNVTLEFHQNGLHIHLTFFRFFTFLRRK